MFFSRYFYRTAFCYDAHPIYCAYAAKFADKFRRAGVFLLPFFEKRLQYYMLLKIAIIRYGIRMFFKGERISNFNAPLAASRQAALNTTSRAKNFRAAADPGSLRGKSENARITTL